MASDKTITLAEVAQHSTRADCWMAHNGLVYDVAKFLDDHPGGPEIMMEHAGKDMTTDFEDIGHSKSAREMMRKMMIGKLPDGEGSRLGSKSSGSGAASGSGKAAEGSGLGGILLYAAPVVALAAGIYYQFIMPKA